jgi:hypothetical protein
MIGSNVQSKTHKKEAKLDTLRSWSKSLFSGAGAASLMFPSGVLISLLLLAASVLDMERGGEGMKLWRGVVFARDAIDGGANARVGGFRSARSDTRVTTTTRRVEILEIIVIVTRLIDLFYSSIPASADKYEVLSKRCNDQKCRPGFFSSNET